MENKRLAKLEQQIADLFTARPQFTEGEALTFGQPGDRVRVKVPGKPKRVARAIAATVINSSAVSVLVDNLGQTWAFCDSAPEVARTSPGRKFHSRPSESPEVPKIPAIAFLCVLPNLYNPPNENFQSLGYEYSVFIEGKFIRLPVNLPPDLDVDRSQITDPLQSLNYVQRARVNPASGRITMGKDGGWRVDLVLVKVTSTTGNGNYAPPFDIYNQPFDLQRVREVYHFSYSSGGVATRTRISPISLSITGDTPPASADAQAAQIYRTFEGKFYTVGAGVAVLDEESGSAGNSSGRTSFTSGSYRYFMDGVQVSTQPFNHQGWNFHQSSVTETIELLPLGAQTATIQYTSTNNGNISSPVATYSQINYWLPLKLNPERSRGVGVRFLFSGSQQVHGTPQTGATGQPSFDSVNATFRQGFEFYLATSSGGVFSSGAGPVIRELLDGDLFNTLAGWPIIGPRGRVSLPSGVTVLDADQGFCFARPFAQPLPGQPSQVTIQLLFYSEDLQTATEVELEALAPPSDYVILDYCITPGQVTP